MKSKPLTRNELDDLVWASPISRILKQVNLPDSKLRRIFRRMNIPLQDDCFSYASPVKNKKS